MSVSGTISDQQSLAASTEQRGGLKSEPNLFQKIDILAAELEEVSLKMTELGDECHVSFG